MHKQAVFLDENEHTMESASLIDGRCFALANVLKQLNALLRQIERSSAVELRKAEAVADRFDGAVNLRNAARTLGGDLKTCALNKREYCALFSYIQIIGDRARSNLKIIRTCFAPFKIRLKTSRILSVAASSRKIRHSAGMKVRG